jgi:hypothetical protein
MKGFCLFCSMEANTIKCLSGGKGGAISPNGIVGNLRCKPPTPLPSLPCAVSPPPSLSFVPSPPSSLMLTHTNNLIQTHTRAMRLLVLHSTIMFAIMSTLTTTMQRSRSSFAWDAKRTRTNSSVSYWMCCRKTSWPRSRSNAHALLYSCLHLHTSHV